MARHTIERTHPAWSPREREVLDLIARGRTNGEIATELGISFWTAKWHVSELISKLGVESREEVAAYWRHERRPLTRVNRQVARLFAWPFLFKTVAAAGTIGIGAIGVLLVIAALRSSGPDSSAVTPSATTTATAAATVTEQRRTGIPELDTIIDAVESGDEAKIESLTRYFGVLCSPGGYPAPACPDATETYVDAFAVSTCEQTWVSRGAPWIEGLIARQPKLYAAVRAAPSQGFLGDSPKPPDSYMSGEYVLLFRYAAADIDAGGIGLHVGGGRVVREDVGCGPFPGSQLAILSGVSFVLMPPGGVPAPTPTPVSRHTGNPANDRLIDAMLREDMNALYFAFEAFPEPCSAAQPIGPGSPPPCPTGTPDGGMVMTTRVLACERSAASPFSTYLRSGVEVYAAFPSSAISNAGPYQYSSDWVPTGDVTVVLRRQGAEDGSAWHLAGGRITGVRLGCGETAKQFVADIPASAFILAPLP